MHLNELLKGDLTDHTPVKWTEDCESEFQNMKVALTSPPGLALFREGRETRVELDVSAIAIGGVLSQKDEKTDK